MAAVFTFGMGGASAHQADVQAKADCRGVVSFTVTSWSSGDEGTNDRVGVYYSVDGGKFRPVTPDNRETIVSKSGVEYAFTEENKNSFSDNFVLPGHDKATTVVVKAKALDKWGNGNDDQAEKSQSVDVPAPCKAAETTTTTKAPSRAAAAAAQKARIESQIEPACSTSLAGWTVRLTNEGNAAASATVLVNGTTVSTTEVPAGEEVTVDKAFDDAGIASGAAAKIAVKSGGRQLASATLTNDCVKVDAQIDAVCETTGGSGAVLSFSNTGRLAESFTVTRDGRNVTGSPVTVAPSAMIMRKLLTMAEDESTTIILTGVESGLRIEKVVKLNCVEVLSGAVTATTVPGGGIGAGGEVAVLGAPAEEGNSAELAQTGAPSLWLAGLGTVLSLLGAALLLTRKHLLLATGAHLRR